MTRRTFGDRVALDVGDGDVGRRPDRGDLDALRVDDHASARRRAGGGWSAAATYIVFSIARACSSVRQWCSFSGPRTHSAGTRTTSTPASASSRGDLGEPQVVAGHQSESQAVELERLRRLDLAGLDPVGLALAEGVVQMQLAVVARARRSPSTATTVLRTRRPSAPRSSSPATMCTPCRAASAVRPATKAPSMSSALAATDSSNGSTK